MEKKIHTHAHTNLHPISPPGADGSTVIADVSHINEAHHVLTTTEYTQTGAHTHRQIHSCHVSHSDRTHMHAEKHAYSLTHA